MNSASFENDLKAVIKGTAHRIIMLAYYFFQRLVDSR